MGFKMKYTKLIARVLVLLFVIFQNYSLLYAYYEPETEVFYKELEAPRIYMGKFRLDRGPGVVYGNDVFRIETQNATGDPLIIIMDDEGNQVDSDDDSGTDFNARAKFTKFMSKIEYITVFVLSYNESQAGEANLVISRKTSRTSDIWKEITRIDHIQFGAFPIKTGWRYGDIIRGTGHYEGLTYNETCKKAGYSNVSSCESAYRFKCNAITPGTLNTDFDRKACTHEKACEKIGGDYEGVNEFSDLCEFSSSSSDVMVLAIEEWNWNSPRLQFKYDPFKRKWSSDWYKPGTSMEQRVKRVNDDGGVGGAFKMAMYQNSGSSSALIVGLYPWIISDSCKDRESCVKSVTNSRYNNWYKNALSSKVRIYKDRPEVCVWNCSEKPYADPDWDGISNTLERDFLHTDPDKKDSDNDGINDHFELFGWAGCIYEDNENADDCDIEEIPFYGYGANPNVHDIFLEIDYMKPETVELTNEILEYSFKPKEGELRELSRVYINSNKYDAKTKRIHIELNQTIPFRYVIDFDIASKIGVHSSCSSIELYDVMEDNCYTAYDFENVRDNYLKPIKQFFYHYMVLGMYGWNEQKNIRNRWSGRGEIIGNDTYVAYPHKKTTNTFNGLIYEDVSGTKKNRLGMMIHELGHNFGLLHNGNSTISNRYGNWDEYLSNIHKSVMNFRYMEYGVGGDMDDMTFGTYSYSSGNTFKNDTRNYWATTMPSYSRQYNTSSHYTLSHGSIEMPAVCAKYSTSKLWNEQDFTDIITQPNCNNERGETYCDCDISEWQNLYVDFRFNWEGFEDPDRFGVYEIEHKTRTGYVTLNKKALKDAAESIDRITFYEKMKYFDSNGVEGEYSIKHPLYQIISY